MQARDVNLAHRLSLCKKRNYDRHQANVAAYKAWLKRKEVWT